MKIFIKKHKSILIENKGVASALVLFTVLMFVLILTGIYMGITAIQKAQIKSDLRIQSIYTDDVNEINNVYDALIDVKYDEPYIPTGFTHTEGQWNNGYTIKETTTGNEFVWVPCVTEQTRKSTADGVVTFTKTTTGKYNVDSLGLLPTDTTVAEEDSSVSEIRTSVGTYGGFYIAKYEAGIPGTTASTTTNDVNKQTQNGSVKPVSKQNVGVWNFITRPNAIIVSKAMIDTETTGVKSTLISGECWDTTLQWISKTDSTYAENSTGKGNYTGTIATTGNKTEYVINNIYDMAGNMYEWTTENCIKDTNSCLLYRGGNYYYTGSDRPACYRFGGNNHTSESVGFRVVLYK